MAHPSVHRSRKPTTPGKAPRLWWNLIAPTSGAAILLLASAGCSRSTPTVTDSPSRPPANSTGSVPWFKEVAAEAGVNFRHSSGHKTRFYMPEMMSGGVGLLDYDGDGLLDLYCVNGGSLEPVATNGPGNRLYHNVGNWRFEDVTERAGAGGHSAYGFGCACADYDGDGNVDLYVTNLGRNILYHNNGDGTFTDVTDKAGVGNGSWSTSAAFFDYDGDGRLDLMVVNYIKWSRETEIDCYSRGGLPDYCSPVNYKAPAMSTLYHNRGDGTFENVTVAAGLDKAYGNGLGVVCADIDRDGRLDIFVANDAVPNQLWMNRGDGTFVDEALIRGCAVSVVGMSRAGMGVTAVDLLQRGWLDLYVTHLVGEGNGMFINSRGLFTDTMNRKGPAAGSLPYTGFGLGFSDFDNDGNLDLYVANGRVKYGQQQLDGKDPYAEPNTLLRGLGNGEFEEVTPSGGVTPPLIATSRGLALGDLDNDGSVDAVVVNRDGAVHLLRNQVGIRGRWTLLKIIDRRGTDSIGAVVTIEAGSRVHWRHVGPNEGYCSSSDPRVHCGLGDARMVDRVVVLWPNGQQESFGPFDANRIVEVRQGKGQVAQ